MEKHKYMALVAGNCPKKAEIRLSAFAEVVRLPADNSLPESVRFHPDMILTIFRGRLFAREKYISDNKALIDMICSFCSSIPVTCNISPGKYPYDAALNTLVLADKNILIGRKSILAPQLAELCSVDTKQGYAGCSSLYAAGIIVTAIRQ